MQVRATRGRRSIGGVLEDAVQLRVKAEEVCAKLQLLPASLARVRQGPEGARTR